MQSIYFGLYKTALDVCCTAANLTIMKQIYTIDDKISIIVLKYLINYVILMLLKKSKMEPAPFYSLASQRIMNTIGEVFIPVSAICRRERCGCQSFTERKGMVFMNTKTLLYILKRLVLALLTVWVVITVTFFIMRAVPGGPFASEKAITPIAQAQLEAKYGLDKSLPEQYVTYIRDIVTKFDFGPSLKQRGRNVIDIISDGLKTSAKLGVIAAFSALICGIVLGSVAALRRNKIIDKVIMVVTTAFVSMPSFIMGSLLLVLFSIKFPLFPANGSTSEGLVLPIITLALYPMAYITRLTRSSMLDVLGQDYIRTARAKGVSPVKIIFGHALKNSLIPVITYFGPMLAYIVTGSLVVEQIFAVPGIGRAFVNSITGRDYPLIMGPPIVLSTLVVIMTLVSDILYKVIDPRITLD